MSEQTFTARVAVRLKPVVNDPQGLTVLGSLRDLGYAEIEDVRVGKIIDLTLSAPDEAAARAQIDTMCRDLLVNPVIETYEIEEVAAVLEAEA